MTRLRAIVAALLLLPAIGIHAQEVPRDFAIKLERTSCFGACPVYEVRVDANGRVRYRGVEHVRVTGRATATISRAQVAALAAAVKRSGFFKLKNKYDWPVTDLPTTYVTVTSNGRRKKIEDYHGAPEELLTLEKTIDKTAGTARWIRIDGTTLERMFRDGRPPSPDEQWETMVTALAFDDVDVVETLLAHDFGVRTASGKVPLLHIANSVEATNVLIKAGADVNEVFKTETALNAAAEKPLRVAEALLKAGARIDTQVAEGSGPALVSASCAGHVDLVRLLLAQQADPVTRGRAPAAVLCARAEQKLLAEYEPFLRGDPKPPYIQDFDGVVALLEAAIAKAKPQF